MRLSNKLKRKSYFVIEGIKILKNGGVQELTARNVASAAGFNPGSIYNYFDSMNHLENLASVYFINNYINELVDKTKNSKSGIESYLTMWEVFLKHTFKSPDIYYNVFYSSIVQCGQFNLFKEYYEIFPEQYPKTETFILGMMESDKTQDRGLFVLNSCIEEKSVKNEFIEYINDIHIGYTKFIITDIVKNKLYAPSDELYYKTLKYIVLSMYHYVSEEYRGFLDERLLNYSEKR